MLSWTGNYSTSQLDQSYKKERFCNFTCSSNRKDLASSETQDFSRQAANPAVTLPQGKELCFGLELDVLALGVVWIAKLGSG